MFFIFITKRPTPPLFLGGAEITHNFLAQNLTKMKHRVLFVGSIENPTFPAEERQALYMKLLNDMPAIKISLVQMKNYLYIFRNRMLLVSSA